MTSFAETGAVNAEFMDGLRLLVGQKTSALRNCVTLERVGGERQALDQIGSQRLIQKTGRNVPVPITETARFRRWMEQRDYWNSERFDGFDLLRQKADPTGRLAQSWAASAAREWDRCAIDAALGSALVGKFGDTSVGMPASQIIPHGNTGMTLAKLKQAIKRLRRVNPDRTDSIVVFMTSEQEDELLSSATVSSSEYYAGRPLMDASIPYILGAYVNIIDDYLDLSQPVNGGLPDGSTGQFVPMLPLDVTNPLQRVRTCFAMLKSGVVMGELMPVTTEINEAKTYGINAKQLQVEMSVGGVREHESKVVAIECVDGSPTVFQ